MKKMICLVIALVFIVFAGTAFAIDAVPEEDLKAGFIYIGPVGDGGWTYMHEQGRLEMEEAFPEMTSSYVESVPEGPDSSRVMETFVRKGFGLIFATSFGYMDFVQEVAQRHPEVVFMHCSGYKRAENVGTYFGRMYQARYLSGIVAGEMTKTDTIGFVAAQPIPEVIRGINAFTLGARKVNPDVKVKVIWLFSWFDPGKEKEATKALIDAGSDVIAMHADSGAAPQTAEESGVYVVGYNNDMSEYAPTKQLTAPVWDWGMVYKDTVKRLTSGTWESNDIWWGLKEGLVGLAPFGDDVSSEIRTMVETEKNRIISGEWDVFTGPLKDQEGKIAVPEGESMSDGDMLSMSWFVEGVQGNIPK